MYDRRGGTADIFAIVFSESRDHVVIDLPGLCHTGFQGRERQGQRPPSSQSLTVDEDDPQNLITAAEKDSYERSASKMLRNGLSGNILEPQRKLIRDEDVIRSELIARESLKTCLAALLDDNNRHLAELMERNSRFDKRPSLVWPKHYREAEPYSDTLPAMLDHLAQIWAQRQSVDDTDECPDSIHDTRNLRSPLHLCSALGFEGLGEVYLQMGKDPNVLAYPDGQSALQLAAAGGHTRMMELLLDRDADIEQRTRLTGRSALQLAAFRGHEEAVKFLLEEGADADAKDKFGQTALALATANGFDKVADLLRGFDIDERALRREWERRQAYARNPLHALLNCQHSVEVQMPDRVSPLYMCPLGKECTSWSSPASRHQDHLRHIHEKHPTPDTISNDCGEQQQRFWFCCKCGDGPKCCRCGDQTRCFDCGGPARSNEVDEGWIAVDHQRCTHMHCPNCHENRHVV